jgi:hypothetical protein
MVSGPRWRRDEFYIVVAGTGRYRMEDRATKVVPNDLFFAAHVAHGYIKKTVFNPSCTCFALRSWRWWHRDFRTYPARALIALIRPI